MRPEGDLSKKPRNLPYPVIYGPNFPKIRLQTRDGKQKVFSSTNKNLFLESYDLTESGTFTVGQFLIKSGEWDSRKCHSCNEFCPLFISKMSYEEETNLAQIEESVEGTPEWEACFVIKDLSQHMQSEVEKKWFLEYLNTTYKWCGETRWKEIADKWNEYSVSPTMSGDTWPGELREDLRAELDRSIRFSHASNLMKKAFFAPAPIPQVWLNYVPPWEIKRGSSMESHVRENPSRIDFLIISKGTLRIVEIDGPTHFGVFDQDLGRWIIDEQRYTRNLWIDRSLRKQGYQVHRFSSWEIMRSISNLEEYWSTKKSGKETFFFPSLLMELHLEIGKIEINDEYIQSYPGINPGL